MSASGLCALTWKGLRTLMRALSVVGTGSEQVLLSCTGSALS